MRLLETDIPIDMIIDILTDMITDILTDMDPRPNLDKWLGKLTPHEAEMDLSLIHI